MMSLFPLLALLHAPARADMTATGVWSTSGEEGDAEAFAACVDDYHGDGDMKWPCRSAQYFLDYLYSSWYVNALKFSDDDARPIDFEESGSDDRYNDGADFSLFVGKGSSASMRFADLGGDDTVTAFETRWGDGDVEVVAIDAGQTLDSFGRAAFAAANLNQGVHYILGFDTTTYDMLTTSTYYGYYLRKGYPVRDAWHTSTDMGHIYTHRSAYVRFYSGRCDTYDDALWSLSCDPTSGSSYTWSVWTL